MEDVTCRAAETRLARTLAVMLAVSIVFSALLGAAIGSFGGVLNSRGWRQSVRGRSQCDSCGRTLAWFETVPFISFITQRGRCRGCGASIGWAPLFWEVGGAVVAVAVALPIALALRA
jgi:leader peptidase (prepilin peptidase)/N-methyltransferase